MDLATAQRHIAQHLERMRTAYQRALFDEWAILALGQRGGSVVAYAGPRLPAFRQNIANDAAPLLARAAGQQFAEGDLEFASDAAGTQYDAFMKIGPTSYLVLNHTGKTLAEIRTDAKWLAAQAVLFELSEKFRADPLAVDPE